MNGWTPDMVLRLPASVHQSLVKMLQADDQAHAPKSDGFDLTAGFQDH